jgi:hypothetical protein
MLSGRYVQGQELAERGLVLAEELDLSVLRSHLLNTLGVCRVGLGDLRGTDRIEEALALALETGEPEAIGRAYNNLSDTLTKTGRLRDAVAIAGVGRKAAHRLGAASFEWFIAGNEAAALVAHGRYDEADALTREILDERRAVLATPGVVNAGMTRVVLLDRRGAHQEARALADETLALARGLGGSDFLGWALSIEADLELSRGNGAAARQAMREAAELLADAGHVAPLLPTAARLLPVGEVEPLLDRLRSLPSQPLNDAYRTEAEAVLTGDNARFLEAAALYRKVEMPFEEARCLAAAGHEDAAAEIYERLGIPAPRGV